MLDRKVQWNTEDDDLLADSKTLDRGTDFSAVTLEPQRIRVFNLEYSVKTEGELFL